MQRATFALKAVDTTPGDSTGRNLDGWPWEPMRRDVEASVVEQVGEPCGSVLEALGARESADMPADLPALPPDTVDLYTGAPRIVTNLEHRVAELEARLQAQANLAP